MNKQPKLWEILACFIPVICGIVIWTWNLGTKVEKNGTEIEYLKQGRIEYKQDIKEISNKLEEILIRMENKQDRAK